MNALRPPFYLAALVCLVLALVSEIGSRLLTPPQPGKAELGRLAMETEPKLPDPAEVTGDERQSRQDAIDKRVAEADIPKGDPPPGLGVAYLVLIDALFLFVVATVGLGFLFSSGVWSRIHGWSMFIAALIAIIVGIVLVLAAFAKLLLMVGMFLAAPFGTIAYLVMYGFFARGAAGAILSTALALKIGAGVCLVLALQRILENKALVGLALTAMVSSVIVSFLHGLVPGILVSITDAIAALIVAILGIVWALILLVSAVPAVVKSLRPRLA